MPVSGRLWIKDLSVGLKFVRLDIQEERFLLDHFGGRSGFNCLGEQRLSLFLSDFVFKVILSEFGLEQLSDLILGIPDGLVVVRLDLAELCEK